MPLQYAYGADAFCFFLFPRTWRKSGNNGTITFMVTEYRYLLTPSDEFCDDENCDEFSFTLLLINRCVPLSLHGIVLAHWWAAVLDGRPEYNKNCFNSSFLCDHLSIVDSSCVVSSIHHTLQHAMVMQRHWYIISLIILHLRGTIRRDCHTFLHSHRCWCAVAVASQDGSE